MLFIIKHLDGNFNAVNKLRPTDQVDAQKCFLMFIIIY